MDNQTIFLALIAVFVAISAAAMVFQAAMLYGTYKASREMRDRIVPLTVKVDALVETSRSTVDEARLQMREITTKAGQILDVAREQMETLEDVLEDASLRTRRQLERAEIVVDDALARAQDTVELVHKGILAPIRGINGVAAGVRAALHFLLRGTRPSPDQVTVDEEMFI
jgi:CBS-domain-containing membrane protein